MSFTAMIDADRVIHAITGQEPKPPEWAVLKTALTEQGLTLSEEALAVWPTGYRRGRVLAGDGLSCSDPVPSAPPVVTAEARNRAAVLDWATEAASLGAVLRGFHDVPRFRLWLSIVRGTLAAVQTDEHAAGSGWQNFQQALNTTAVLFMDKADHWSGKETAVHDLTEYHAPVQSIVNGPVVPIRIPAVTAAHLAAGADYADSVLYEIGG